MAWAVNAHRGMRGPVRALAGVLAGVVAAAIALAPAPNARGEPAGSPGDKPAPTPVRTYTPEEARSERARLDKAWLAAFDARDYAGAEASLRELIPLDAGNFVHWYNLACVLALRGERDESVQMLRQAMARGFTDRTQLETDPNLSAIRDHETYRAILDNWEAFIADRAAKAMEGARRTFPSPPYTFETDEERRLLFISAFTAESFAKARAELHALDALWDATVAPADPALRGLPSASPSDPMISVILPRPEDYATWARRHFGERAERVGGAYLNDDLQLVAQDLGSTLRHEYWHVLHWRHMNRLGQRHPYWVMEGLCSLVEDVDVGPTGALVPVASWRTNTARRLELAGGLVPWEVLFALPRERFMGSRPLAAYAQSRSVFLWLFQEGKLREWYTAYVASFKEDPTGRVAFEKTFDRPVRETERQYRAWLRALPEVAEMLRPGAAQLPLELGQGPGDGLIVASLPASAAGRATGLRPRDVVTAVDGRPVRDLNDLARVLGELEPGETVEVRYRRGPNHLSTRATLVPAE
jgi:hypothetical protein